MNTIEHAITLTRTYAQPPAEVFNAWVEPELLRQWYAPVDGWVVGSANVTPGVGGSYAITFGPAPAGDRYLEQGEYTEFEAPLRLAWTGTLNADAATPLTIEVTFREVDGGTEVTVIERQLPSSAVADEHTEGWSEALRHLGQLLAAQ